MGLKYIYIWRRIAKNEITCSPPSISLKAITSMPFQVLAAPPAGNTTTAFGSQEWLNRAVTGDIAKPIGSKEGDDRVKLFEANCKRERSNQNGFSEVKQDVFVEVKQDTLTAVHKSRTSATLLNPNQLISTGFNSSSFWPAFNNSPAARYWFNFKASLTKGSLWVDDNERRSTGEYMSGWSKTTTFGPIQEVWPTRLQCGYCTPLRWRY